jgi:hypothetical protein
MKRFSWVSILLAAIVVASLGGMAYAAYDYSYTIRVFNNSTTSYSTGLPVLISVNNSQLYDFGYISASGLDMDVQEGATSREFMIDSTYLGVFIPSIAGQQSRTLRHRLGYDPVQTNFPVVVGVGGNVTVSDATALELGNNFTVSLEGYLDVTQTGLALYDKLDAVRTYINASGELVTEVYNAEAVEEAQATESSYQHTHDLEWHAQSFNHTQDFWLTKIEIDADAEGTPVGDYVASLRATSGGQPTGSDIASANITGTSMSAWNEFDFTDTFIAANVTYAIVLRVPDSSADANDVNTNHHISAGYANGQMWMSSNGGSSWTSPGSGAWDVAFRVYGKDIDASVFTTISSGVQEVSISANVTSLGLFIDDALVDSTSFSGLSVSNSANDYVLMSDAVPYMSNMTLAVNGTQQLWFQPVTMTSGNLVTDRQGSDNNGTINWGSNPANIEITIEGIEASVVTVPDAGINTTVPDFLPSAPAVVFHEDALGDVDPALQAMPLYPSVNATATSLEMSTRVAYVILIWLGSMVIGVAGFLAVHTTWGFIGGYGFGNLLALATPVWPEFLAIIGGFILILGFWVWRHN